MPTPQSTTAPKTPHLLAGFVPASGLTLLLAPPLLGALDLAASFALAVRQGRNLFLPSSDDPDQIFPAPPKINWMDPSPSRPILFATHHPDRVESFWNRHPEFTDSGRVSRTVHFITPPGHNEPIEDIIDGLTNSLDALSLAAAADPARTPPVVEPSSTAPSAPATNLSAAPTLFITLPKTSNRDLAQLTTALGALAATRQIPILAFLPCNLPLASFAAALNVATALPGVAAIVSLRPDPLSADNRILSSHLTRGVRAEPVILFAPLMEPRLDCLIPISDPTRDVIVTNFGPRRARLHAMNFLSQQISRGKHQVKDLVEEAEALGISRATLYRARHELALVNHPNDTKYYGASWHNDQTPPDTFTHRLVQDLAAADATTTAATATTPQSQPSQPSQISISLPVLATTAATTTTETADAIPATTTAAEPTTAATAAESNHPATTQSQPSQPSQKSQPSPISISLPILVTPATDPTPQSQPSQPSQISPPTAPAIRHRTPPVHAPRRPTSFPAHTSPRDLLAKSGRDRIFRQTPVSA